MKKSKTLKKFETILEKYWDKLPIEVCHAWETFENETNSYESAE